MAARSLFLLAAALVALGDVPPLPAEPAASGAMDVLQVVADLTLIDGACSRNAVNFGVVFRFAADKGVPEVAIMPGGSGRSAFEAVLRARRASFDQDELCGEIAANYAEALPGSVSFRPDAGARP